MVAPAGQLYQLFLLNLTLQLFDGVATYHGVATWGEANPLLRDLMPAVGAGLTLLLYKAKACAFLVLMLQFGRRAVPYVDEGLAVVAGTYLALSFVPWMSRYLSLLTI